MDERTGACSEAFNVRLEELCVIDMVWLHPHTGATAKDVYLCVPCQSLAPPTWERAHKCVAAVIKYLGAAGNVAKGGYKAP